MHCASAQEKSEPVPCEPALASLSDILDQAFAQLAEGRFEDAIEGFSEYLLIEPGEAKAYQGRAQAYFQVKNWTAAISDFKKAAELNPGEQENYVGWGMGLAMVNQIYEAIAVFDDLLARYPDYTRGHIQLGMLYYRLGIIKKGHHEMDLALASRPALEERQTIERLKGEQMTLDKKRLYRPDFEELRRANEASEGVLQQVLNFIKSKFRKK